jgi:hypothetical protein
LALPGRRTLISSPQTRKLALFGTIASRQSDALQRKTAAPQIANPKPAIRNRRRSGPPNWLCFAFFPSAWAQPRDQGENAGIPERWNGGMVERWSGRTPKPLATGNRPLISRDSPFAIHFIERAVFCRYYTTSS